MTDIFDVIYAENRWKSKESRSGPGSTLKATETVREEFCELLKEYGIRSVLDIPCGDFHWMKEIIDYIPEYLGADVVEDLIAANRANYPGINFHTLDATSDFIPPVDLIFCRELLQHLSEFNAKKVLSNFISSEARYLLITSHDTRKKVKDIEDGQYAPRDLLQPPFSLPWPTAFIRDVGIKLMFLYDLEDLR